MILSMANGPKLNGRFVPLAVGAYIMSLGTMGGPYEGAAMNPARAFGPDLARGDLSTWWVYVVGPLAGAVIAVGAAWILRGPAKAQEAQAAQAESQKEKSLRERIDLFLFGLTSVVIAGSDPSSVLFQRLLVGFVLLLGVVVIGWYIPYRIVEWHVRVHGTRNPRLVTKAKGFGLFFLIGYFITRPWKRGGRR